MEYFQHVKVSACKYYINLDWLLKRAFIAIKPACDAQYEAFVLSSVLDILSQFIFAIKEHYGNQLAEVSGLPYSHG